MDKMWNLTADQWATVLGSSRDNPATIGEGLRRTGVFVPWSQLLVDETTGFETTLDLGSGRGEHSAVLARHGRHPVLVDWSDANLQFSRGVFHTLGLRGTFCQADITQPLPFRDESIDVVFSCGVFEYFNAAQVDRILHEAFRVARHRVIVLVPNARSLAYRLGKWHMERSGTWVWGGEVPSHSLVRPFRTAGAVRVREYTVAARHALAFLTMRGGPRLAHGLIKALRLTDHARRARLRQGYLLVAVGDKAR